MRRHLLLMVLVTLAAAPAAARGGSDRQDPVSSPTIEALDIAQMLRSDVDLSWLAILPTGNGAILQHAEQRAVGQVRALADYARRRGIADRPDAAGALRAMDTVVLAEFAKSELLAGIVVTDADIKAEIDRHPGLYDEYQLRHILVAVGKTRDGRQRSEADARALAADLHRRLQGGEPFEALAAAMSDDTSTAGDGGALSAIRGVYMVDAIFPAVRSLRTGAISDPVRSPAGFHIVKLDRRTIATPAVVRPIVVARIRANRLPAVIDAATLPSAHRAAAAGTTP